MKSTVVSKYMLKNPVYTLDPRGFLTRGFRASKRKVKPNARALVAHVRSFEHADPIRSRFQVSETLAFLKMASDWIGAFKGTNVCGQRFFHQLTLVRERGKPLGPRMPDYEANEKIDK